MTNYERGTKLERDIQHLYEHRGLYCIRSAGSHGPADLIIIANASVIMIQVKLHDKLRDAAREQELRQMQKPNNVSIRTAWKLKQGKRNIIVMLDLITGQESVVYPLTKEQEKVYQARKRVYFESRRTKKRRAVMVPNTTIR